MGDYPLGSRQANLRCLFGSWVKWGMVLPRFAPDNCVHTCLHLDPLESTPASTLSPPGRGRGAKSGHYGATWQVWTHLNCGIPNFHDVFDQPYLLWGEGSSTHLHVFVYAYTHMFAMCSFLKCSFQSLPGWRFNLQSNFLLESVNCVTCVSWSM